MNTPSPLLTRARRLTLALVALIATLSITSLVAAEGDAPTAQHFVYLPLVNRSVVTQVANGNFESGATGWTVYSTKGRSVIRTSFSPNTVTPLNGAWGAWLGGMYSEITHLEQSIKVYAGTAYLAYWHYIASADYCGYDFARVSVNGAQVDQYDLCTTANTNGWRKHVVNLSAYAGQTVTVRIRVTTDGSLNSNLFVDEVAFQATGAVQLAPDGVNDLMFDEATLPEWADLQQGLRVK
jgi:hypothetical protein